MSRGQERYEQAKRLIPGGTQLLSKRPELYAPGLWPPYASKALGATIWDLDGTAYLDMSTMGIGSCVLGYADSEVNDAVKQVVDAGSMCSLSFEEELLLAERLIELHPWADMARFARTGGEILAQAIRIARAATGREKILFCGYHGWHDWYLAGNLCEGDALGGHLLAGLDPAGVPKALEGTAIPFHYNNTEEFLSAFEKDNVAVVIMEPIRYTDPEPGFLETIRQKTKACGTVLIFDEVTSGWRRNVGAAHTLFNIIPDMAVFAKAMSNGYPCAAVIGIESVMQAAQNTFISSTYWTERLGFAAALATIQAIEERDVPKRLLESGTRVHSIWREASKMYGVPVTIEGHPSLSHFSIEHPKSKVLQTILSQNLLDSKILGNMAYYASYAHSEEDLDLYEKAFLKAFKTVAKAYESDEPEIYLRGPVALSGFTRL